MKNKDFRKLFKALDDQLWKVTHLSNGHYQAVPPDPEKSIVHISDSPEPRALKNAVAECRAQGFVWPPPGKGKRKKNRTEAPSGAAAGDAAPASDDDLEELKEVLAELDDVSDLFPDEPEAGAPPDALDDAFALLKEARQFAALAEAHVREREVQLQEAQELLEKARSDLKGAREKFNRVFEEPV